MKIKRHHYRVREGLGYCSESARRFPPHVAIPLSHERSPARKRVAERTSLINEETILMQFSPRTAYLTPPRLSCFGARAKIICASWSADNQV